MPRFTFKKTERLSSLKAIETLYGSGSSFNVNGLRVIYLFHPGPQSAPCQVVFSVPKRNFKKAVDRNLLKRRLREAYRFQKAELYASLASKNSYLHLAFVYNLKEKMEFNEIQEALRKALKNLSDKIGN